MYSLLWRVMLYGLSDSGEKVSVEDMIVGSVDVLVLFRLLRGVLVSVYFL